MSWKSGYGECLKTRRTDGGKSRAGCQQLGQALRGAAADPRLLRLGEKLLPVVGAVSWDQNVGHGRIVTHQGRSRILRALFGRATRRKNQPARAAGRFLFVGQAASRSR
jgi:hypothetical protein